jgi:hypothetical protein
VSNYFDAPMEWTRCYSWQNIIYVPHFHMRGYYVGPGYGRATTRVWTADALILAGAEQVSLQLWSRPGA